MNPTELGYFEKTLGSGTWYHPDKGRATFEPRVCENTNCRAEFMGTRQKGRGRFCTIACSKWKSDPGYSGKHMRLHRSLGSASAHTCVDCRQPAKEWSQTHGTAGTAPQDYQPRCKTCHRVYDAPHLVKLTEDDVREIRRLWATGEYTQHELAELFDVDRSSVSLICNWKIWENVK